MTTQQNPETTTSCNNKQHQQKQNDTNNKEKNQEEKSTNPEPVDSEKILHDKLRDEGDICFALDTLFLNKEYVETSVTVPVFRGGTVMEDPATTKLLNVKDGGDICGAFSALAEGTKKTSIAENDEKNNSKNEETVLRESITLTVKCSASACTDYDLTGQVIWPVSVLLGHYMASKRGRHHISSPDSTVVELGAGCAGLPGMVASHVGAQHVLLTDGNDNVVQMLQENVSCQQKHLHVDPYHQLMAQKLVWGHVQDLRHVFHTLETCRGGTTVVASQQHLQDQRNKQITLPPPVHVVLAADVVQWPAVVEPFLHTVKALLWSASIRNASQTQACANHEPSHDDVKNVSDSGNCGVLVIGLVKRSDYVTNLFFETAHRLGFVVARHTTDDVVDAVGTSDNPGTGVRDGASAATLTPKPVPYNAFLHQGKLPTSCQEVGGKLETEIYELYLDPQLCLGTMAGTNKNVIPKLLCQVMENKEKNANEQDWTVGKGFHHTSFMPC